MSPIPASGALPDDPKLHRYLLAYASDFHFLMTALYPHGVSWLSAGMQVASLDHAMWFHRPFRMDRWLLYDIDSPARPGPGAWCTAGCSRRTVYWSPAPRRRVSSAGGGRRRVG